MRCAVEGKLIRKTLQSVKIGGCLARNARFDAPACHNTSRLEPLVFLWLCRVYGGKLQNLSLLKVSNQVVMLFCMASVALLHRFKKSNVGAACGEDLSCVESGRRNILDTLHFTLHTLHFTLYTLHFTLYTLHFTLYTLHFTLPTLHSTLYTLHSTL